MTYTDAVHSNAVLVERKSSMCVDQINCLTQSGSLWRQVVDSSVNLLSVVSCLVNI